MDKVGIIPNTTKDINFEVTKQIIDWIIQKGCTPLISEQVANLIDVRYGVNINEIYSMSDFLIVLGGDGTLLSVAKNAALHNTPLMGINLGTLGFLTDVEKSEAKLAFEKVLNNEFTLEKRMMLEANILTQSTTHETLLGLNDICITRGSFSRIIKMKIYINDEFVDVFPADGIIVSTPTGSTAYNLSAGGPILVPNAQMMVITPICPHTLYSRSFVVSGEDSIKVEIEQNVNNDIILNIDGQIGNILKNNDIVAIKKSKYYTTIIKTNKLGFYNVLRRKITGMGREFHESTTAIENKRINK